MDPDDDSMSEAPELASRSSSSSAETVPMRRLIESAPVSSTRNYIVHFEAREDHQSDGDGYRYKGRDIDEAQAWKILIPELMPAGNACDPKLCLKRATVSSEGSKIEDPSNIFIRVLCSKPLLLQTGIGP